MSDILITYDKRNAEDRVSTTLRSYPTEGAKALDELTNDKVIPLNNQLQQLRERLESIEKKAAGLSKKLDNAFKLLNALASIQGDSQRKIDGLEAKNWLNTVEIAGR